MTHDCSFAGLAASTFGFTEREENGKVCMKMNETYLQH
jgi:hypothetical protein